MRRSRSTRWRAAVLVGVHVLFALHLVHLWSSGSTISPVEPSEAMEYSKHSVVNAGLVFFAATILLTLVFGRFFCGWGCHLVALQDLSRALLLRIGIRPRPLRSRLLALVPGVAFVYMFLWPLFYRLWIGDSFDSARSGFFTSDFWRTFPGLVVALLTFVVCGFVTVYFLGSKGFCTYACPYGAIFGAVDRVAPGRIRVTDACEGCGHCTATCTSNVLVHQEVRDYGMVVDPGCMKCMDCVSVCPKGALYFGFGRPALGARARREPKKRRPALSWGEEGLLALSFIATFLAFRGLYQTIPFLLSLGWAGVVAFATLCAWRLVREPRVQFQNLVLKAGKLTPAGRTFSFAFLLFAPLWAHSGWIQFHTWRAGEAMDELAGARARFMRVEPAPLDRAESERLAALARHNAAAQRFGLIATAENAYRAAWERMLHGDRTGYARWMARAVELDTRGGARALEYGGFLDATGDLDGAERTYRRAVATGGEESGAVAVLARFLVERRRDVEAAREVLRAALERHPSDAALHDGLGQLATAAGDAPAAIQSFRRALQLEPGHFGYRDRLVAVLMFTGEGQAGLALLEEGVARNPDGVREHTALGLGARALGDAARAEQAFRRAIELDPGAAQGAMAALAELLRQDGRGEEAEDWARRARGAAESAPQAHK